MTQTQIANEIDFTIDSIDTLIRMLDIKPDAKRALVGSLYRLWSEVEQAIETK